MVNTAIIRVWCADAGVDACFALSSKAAEFSAYASLASIIGVSTSKGRRAKPKRSFDAEKKRETKKGGKEQKQSTARIPKWSPTLVLTNRHVA
jgi:hypothetical protein